MMIRSVFHTHTDGWATMLLTWAWVGPTTNRQCQSCSHSSHTHSLRNSMYQTCGVEGICCEQCNNSVCNCWGKHGTTVCRRVECMGSRVQVAGQPERRLSIETDEMEVEDCHPLVERSGSITFSLSNEFSSIYPLTCTKRIRATMKLLVEFWLFFSDFLSRILIHQ